MCGVAAGCATGSVSERDRELARTRQELAADALHQSDYRRALDEGQKGEALDPTNADIQYALGLTYFSGFGRMDDAEKHLKRALALRENFSDAHNLLGNVYLAKSDCKKAIPHFRAAMENLLWPTPYLAEQNLGWCMYREGQKEEGAAHIKNAVNIHPKLCGGYDYLARIYTDTNREGDSALWLERYLKQCDTDDTRGFLAPGQLESVVYRLGMAYLKAGEPEKARAQFSNCAERFSAHEVAAECRKNLSLME